MKNALLVDKKVAGIIRWLERLKQSYSSGALENALMDAECARADLENLRQDVWSKVMPVENHESKKFSPWLITFSKAAFLAVLVILLNVVPIAKDVQVPEPVVTQATREIEIILAEPVVVARDVKTVNTPTKKTAAAKSSTPKKSSSTSTKIENTKPVQKEKTVAYDKVFSLVQTGQRALKNNSSVIKIK